MPGIVGLVTRMSRECAQQKLASMLKAMQHEPFYGSGTLSDERVGLYVGWVFRNKSLSDKMPIVGRGSASLIFAGEEFSQSCRTRRCLDGKGAGLEYLVESYESDASFPAS